MTMCSFVVLKQCPHSWAECHLKMHCHAAVNKAVDRSSYKLDTLEISGVYTTA